MWLQLPSNLLCCQQRLWIRGRQSLRLCPPRTASAAGQSGQLAHHAVWSQDPPPRVASRASWAFGSSEDGKTMEALHWQRMENKEKRKIWNQPSSCSRRALGLCRRNHKHNLMYVTKTKANSKQNSKLTFTVLIHIGHTAVLWRIFYSPGI